MSEQESKPPRNVQFAEFSDLMQSVCGNAKGWSCGLVAHRNAFSCVLGDPTGVRLEASLSFTNNLRIVTRIPSKPRHRAGMAAYLLPRALGRDWRNGDQIVDAELLRKIVSHLVATVRILCGCRRGLKRSCHWLRRSRRPCLGERL